MARIIQPKLTAHAREAVKSDGLKLHPSPLNPLLGPLAAYFSPVPSSLTPTRTTMCGGTHFARERTAIAIAGEGVHGPLAHGAKVELVVRRLPFHRDEGVDAGVLPELHSDGRRA
jgi:hypothetical protein